MREIKSPLQCFLFFLKKLVFYSVALDLHCITWAFSSCDKWRLLIFVVHRLLISTVSLVTEH